MYWEKLSPIAVHCLKKFQREYKRDPSKRERVLAKIEARRKHRFNEGLFGKGKAANRYWPNYLNYILTGKINED